MKWHVELKESVIQDLRWFGPKVSRLILDASVERLTVEPLLESRNMKTLRSNAFARRELRLFGKYRVLFTPYEERRVVTIVLVGEKRGNSLLVRGEEFTAHHESHPAE
jgi:mRNA-degrading endonuclease RelE of RelBE toxin-antitoxin system